MQRAYLTYLCLRFPAMVSAINANAALHICQQVTAVAQHIQFAAWHPTAFKPYYGVYRGLKMYRMKNDFKKGNKMDCVRFEWKKNAIML